MPDSWLLCQVYNCQNYGVAHYAGIGIDATDSENVDMAIRSALIGIWRHYREKAPQPSIFRVSDRLMTINTDFVGLVASARKLLEYRYLGSPDTSEFDAGRIDHFQLLREIGLIYQFGKGDRPKAYSPTKVLENLHDRKLLTFGAKLAHSSYKLFSDSLIAMGKWTEAFHTAAVSQKNEEAKASVPNQLKLGDELAQHSFKLSRYELLRDFGRVLGQGSMHRFRKIGPNRQLLLIDDEVHKILASQKGCPRFLDDQEQDPIVRLLGHGLSAVGIGPESVHVVSSDYVDAYIGLMQANGLSKLLPPAKPDNVLALNLEGTPSEVRHDLDEYLAILIDPESRRDPCGPIRVQQLNAILRHRFGYSDSDTRGLLPPLLAYSRKESSGYVQQCLNMGASAFVPKTRPYQLLFSLSRALRDERRQHGSSGQASQFRILKTLKPHVAAKLLRKSGPSFIHGGLTLPSGKHVEDPREARWIRNLPKADLHFHFGTAIRSEVVQVLAMNTAGHFLTGVPDSGDGRESPLLQKFARTLAITARLERKVRTLSPPVSFSRMELLAAAANAVRPNKPLENSPFGLGDAIVRHLLEPNDRCDEAHGTALLVAMMATRDEFGLTDSLRCYFEKLASLGEKGVIGSGEVAFESDAALAFEMARAQKHYNGVACRWSGSCTRDDFEALSRTNDADFWRVLLRMIEVRLAFANDRLQSSLTLAFDAVETDDAGWLNAIGWLNEYSHSLKGLKTEEPYGPLCRQFNLDDYVAVPDVENGRGLQLYLRGADLLGSSHLQYPENLWMAAVAITRDNADENVVYSEVRCETSGYTKAGMGAHDATEILRHGFNLASLYVAGLSKPDDPRHLMPLVRTNILLAAKRHKTEGEVRAVINLLEVYLERRAAVADAARSRRSYAEKFGRTIPPWWRPCDVVGFDLSGDESRDRDWLKAVIVPLAARSSPVTIHAGEAANAESIWRAVYELNALRIGHGLRLNEDIALLSYCVREGICMEFCPNSNRYTNQLTPQPRRYPNENTRNAPLRYEYPLLHYLSQGMEVSLGTDNRYLHPLNQRTLTSEYLTAAELVGGLTRWEVLQVVKAGFKNAFLDKSEVEALIGSVEEEIYRIVATDFE